MPSESHAGEQVNGEVLILGPVDAGKSLLVKQLRLLAKAKAEVDAEPAGLPETQPTTGTEVDYITAGKYTYKVREMGGTFIELWPKYFAAAIAVIFVVDSASAETLSTSSVEVFRLLGDSELKARRILLLFNKRDAPCACPRELLDLFFRPRELVSMKKKSGVELDVLEGSATQQETIQKVLDWLAL
eukprot:tig00000076_g2405.t1